MERKETEEWKKNHRFNRFAPIAPLLRWNAKGILEVFQVLPYFSCRWKRGESGSINPFPKHAEKSFAFYESNNFLPKMVTEGEDSGKC